MKYIYHHLGLGDHIICNGLVRHFREKYGSVYVFCLPHNYKNVMHMYRDDKNIIVIQSDNIDEYINEKKISEDVIMIGFHLLQWGVDTFDKGFYDIANLPFEYRFSKFVFNRDLEKEDEVYRKYNPNNEKYMFFHGLINETKVRSDLKIIQNPLEVGIFDLLKLIENAEEVHIEESSIKCLVNSFKLEKPKLFYHQYCRGYDDFLNSKGLNEFEIIY